jgi:hypothetical protein
VVLLDFAKAFDKVQHSVLINKFRRIGISDQISKWFADFLSGRSQQVLYKGAMSVPVAVKSGVVQGSMADPLAFTIVINDLPTRVKRSFSFIFADDFKVVGDANNEECNAADAIQNDLNAIGGWANENCLPLSLSKCVCIHYGYHNRRRQYIINGEAVKAEQQI